MSDKFLVLANSKKKIAEHSSGDTGRCIAGIRIKNNGDCEWLRPVDPNTETGAIPIREANKYPLFSLVDVDIIGEDSHKKSYQYENKIVKLGTEKHKITKEKFLKILEDFKQDSGNNILGVYPKDRIAVEKEGNITGSLKIIAPKYFKFYKQETTGLKLQIRVSFSFDNKSWRDIVVTDGYFINEYGNKLNYINNLKEKIYIVTSLGLPFNGFIYLLAACVFFLKDEYFMKENNKIKDDFYPTIYTPSRIPRDGSKKICKSYSSESERHGKSIEDIKKEFFRLKNIENALCEAQNQVKNVEVAYNPDTGEIRYKIAGKLYSENDIINVDGYVFPKNIVIKFNGKILVKSGLYLYNPVDIEKFDEYEGTPKKGSKPVAEKIIHTEMYKNYTPKDISKNKIQSVPQIQNRYSREEVIRMEKEVEKQRKREDFRDNVGAFFGLIRIIFTILFFIYGIIDGISDLFD